MEKNGRITRKNLTNIEKIELLLRHTDILTHRHLNPHWYFYHNEGMHKISKTKKTHDNTIKYG